MQLVAGKKLWWISDKCSLTLKDFSGSSVAAGAAVALVTAMEHADADSAKYELDDWQITVIKKKK
jgi:hypothetical protein